MSIFRLHRTSFPTPPRSAKAARCAMERAAPSRSVRCMRNFNKSEALLPVWLILAGAPLFGQSAPSPFAGSAACGACHEDIFNAFQKSPHARVDTDKHRGFVGRACESCHGPAQKHTESASADDIRQPAKLTAAAADQICLGCHLNQPTNVGRLQSSHAKDQVACTACHKVHANGPAGIVARKASAINELC